MQLCLPRLQIPPHASRINERVERDQHCGDPTAPRPINSRVSTAHPSPDFATLPLSAEEAQGSRASTIENVRSREVPKQGGLEQRRIHMRSHLSVMAVYELGPMQASSIVMSRVGNPHLLKAN